MNEEFIDYKINQEKYNNDEKDCPKCGGYCKLDLAGDDNIEGVAWYCVNCGEIE